MVDLSLCPRLSVEQDQRVRPALAAPCWEDGLSWEGDCPGNGSLVTWAPAERTQAYCRKHRLFLNSTLDMLLYARGLCDTGDFKLKCSFLFLYFFPNGVGTESSGEHART